MSIYLTFPISPVPANYVREPMWMNDSIIYESGARQGHTPWIRPLYRFEFRFINNPESRRKVIEDFWNARKGNVEPFLWTDVKTEHSYVASAAPNYNVTSNEMRFYTATDSWRCFPLSGSFTLTSATSGALVNGVTFTYSQNNGVAKITNILSTDTYRWVGTHARVVIFDQEINPSARIYDQYDWEVAFREILP